MLSMLHHWRMGVTGWRKQEAKVAITGPLTAEELAKVEQGLQMYGKAPKKWELISQMFMPHRTPKWLPRLYNTAVDQRLSSDASGQPGQVTADHLSCLCSLSTPTDTSCSSGWLV